MVDLCTARLLRHGAIVAAMLLMPDDFATGADAKATASKTLFSAYAVSDEDSTQLELPGPRQATPPQEAMPPESKDAGIGASVSGPLSSGSPYHPGDLEQSQYHPNDDIRGALHHLMRQVDQISIRLSHLEHGSGPPAGIALEPADELPLIAYKERRQATTVMVPCKVQETLLKTVYMEVPILKQRIEKSIQMKVVEKSVPVSQYCAQHCCWVTVYRKEYHQVPMECDQVVEYWDTEMVPRKKPVIVEKTIYKPVAVVCVD